MALNIIKNYLTKNRCYQRNVKRTPIGIQIHTIGTGQGTAQAVADYWNQSGVSACVTYIADCDTPGKVLQCLPESTRSWADAGYGNNNLITIEICESDYIRYTGGANYKVVNAGKFKADILRGYQAAVLLCVDICNRYGWDPTSKLPSGLFLISSHDEGRRAGLSSSHVDPEHIWPRFDLSMDKFRTDVKAAMTGNPVVEVESEPEKYYRIRKTWEDAGTQLGAYANLENAKNACPYGYTVYDWDGKEVYKNTEVKAGIQAMELEGLSETQAASYILEICKPIAKKYGLLSSVCAAQMILESGYCSTKLAKMANNVCGMKCSLSGNTWAGSTWDGKSKVNIKTAEQDKSGNTYYIYADFRAYPCIEDSISDRCAYLLGAMNGDKLRYDGITECKTYKEQISLIKAGGYAKDVSYVDKICNIIKRHNLDKYDEPKDILPKTDEPWYRVRKSWDDAKSQIGAYHNLDKAKECADNNPGYIVYDESGNALYGKIVKPETASDILAQCEKFQKQLLSDIKAGKPWEYHNPGKYLCEQWGKALEKGKRACNCALLARWALKESGLIPQDTGIFYGKKGGTIAWGKGAKEAVSKTCDIIKVGKKTVKQLINSGELLPGDIVTYVDLQHTNIYAGNGKWYDAGHAYCSGSGEGAVFKSWYGDGKYDNQKVGYIIRKKGAKQYTVQTGVFEEKRNAEKQASDLRAAGFSAIIKEDAGQYIVQAGVFAVEENAENLIGKLKEKGFPGIVK